MTGVPSNIIIPWVGVEFDSSRAQVGSGLMPVNVLVIGQMTSGSGEALTLYLCNTAEEVAEKFGLGSQIHRMAIYIFKNNTTVPVWFIALADATGTPAEWEFTITGPATEDGSFIGYVAGQRYSVSVTDEDTATEIGDAWVAKVNLDTELQATFANDAGVITGTVKNDGVAAGDLDIRFNHNQGEKFPAGVSVGAVTNSVPGATDPSIADALAVIGDGWFNVICQPYTDSTSMDAVEDFLATQSGPMVQRDSLCYQAVRDSQADLITYGQASARNSQFMSVLGLKESGGELECTYEYAAMVAAAVAASIQEDPAVPLHRMTLSGATVVDVNNRWTPTERNQLALAGISTLTHNVGVQTEATVTMYLKNSAAAADTAYQQQNMIFELMAARYSFVNRILTKYPRAKLANNADGLQPGQQIMTEEIGKDEAVAWFIDGQYNGIFEGGSDALSAFKDALVVLRDTNNVNRINWLLPPDMMNQFIVGSGTLQFRS